MNIILKSGTASLIVQLVSMVVGTYVLLLPTNAANATLKIMLVIENVVNLIELVFYIWMLYNFNILKNITTYRYYDWMVTTPTMLFTYIMYLNVVRKKETGESTDFFHLVTQEKEIIATVFGLNWLMLLMGYLGETGRLRTGLTTALGFVPFVAMFAIIYVSYARHTTIGSSTFFYFAVIWGLYGVAALLSYKIKNSMYNILDLFAKNFFGLFIAYMVVFGS
jgi:bacteriorhodopsin